MLVSYYGEAYSHGYLERHRYHVLPLIYLVFLNRGQALEWCVYGRENLQLEQLNQWALF